LKIIWILLKGDLKNIRRDAVLIMAFFAPLLLILFTNLGLPLIREFAIQEFSYDLSVHYHFFSAFLLLLIPLLLGTLSGFLILEEKESGLLMFFSVTPLTRKGYFYYRVFIPFFLGAIFSFLVSSFSGLLTIPLSFLAPIILIAALEAPIITLFLGTFATNRVEGLAFSKGLGVMFAAPVSGYLIESNWHFLAGLIPPYWITQAFLAAKNSQSLYFLYLAGGFFIHLLFLNFLIKRFLASVD